MDDVFWAPRALNDLTALWLDGDAELRAMITEAAAEIDSLLSIAPEEVGESRYDNRRIAFVGRLGSFFEFNGRMAMLWLPRCG